MTPTEDADVLALEPCPFCSCEAWVHCGRAFTNGAIGYRVECEGTCHAMTCWWHTKKEAVTHWNTRALSRPVPEGFVLVPRGWALEAKQIASNLEDPNSTKAFSLPDAVSFLRRLAAAVDPGRPVPHHGSGP
jgi:hypothetical protein